MNIEVFSYLIILIFLVLPVIFSSSSFTMGVTLILLSICCCAQISVISSLWFSVLFYLIYVGGVLVLFFYILTLQVSQVLVEQNSRFVVVIFLFFLFLAVNQLVPSGYFINILFHLGSVCLLLFILLLILWVLSKINLITHSSLRPYF